MPPSGPLPEGNDDTFVIQEHHARSLHWDVRLERDGVLVSWAVPKGLPLDPKDNRLAVHTEDHPIDYGSFEGDIPAGEYGGGSVILWDRGRYELETWTDREVKVVFHGSRAEGRYVFFQNRRSRLDGAPDGPAADPGLGAGAGRAAPDDRDPGPMPAGGRRRWAYELAWSGHRVLVAVEGGRVRATDARGADVSAGYPELRAIGPALGARVCLLDGEVVVLGNDGRPDSRAPPSAPRQGGGARCQDAREAP